MFKKDALVVYKTRPARVVDIADKISIMLMTGETVKVREKDIVFLHPGPLTGVSLLESLAAIAETSALDKGVREAWELLSGSRATLREAAELAFGAWSPESAWRMYLALREGIYFSGTIEDMTAKDAAQVDVELQKRTVKAGEEAEREAFLDRLRKRSLTAEDRRFMQDVEALALGRSEKSRTMKDAGLSEDPVAAHRLLLETGVWDVFVNPYPARNGCAAESAKSPVSPPGAAHYANEDRVDLTRLKAFAIDNEGSEDPDDAIAVTEENGETVLWIHVADPAASVLPDTPADKEARERGTTLYTPDGVYTMLSPDALPLFALGLQEKTPALTFKLTLDADTAIAAVDIMPSWVSVTRLTYRDADALLEKGESPPLAALRDLSRAIFKRRMRNGAVVFDFPDVTIRISGGSDASGKKVVTVEPDIVYDSQSIVKECMLISGEGAALWALRNKIPFPYVSQEAGEIPEKLPSGYAGSYQLRRTMRSRTLSNKPGLHWALGLDLYTQVTSPLRRYTDLLCHQQIRAFLKGAPLLHDDEILARLLQAERGASAANHAQRASVAHWKQVYLADKKGSVWDAVLLEKRKPRSVVLIPGLALETQVALSGAAAASEPGDNLKLTLLKANIPEGEAVWSTS
jgi:exoribonuclease-2